MNLLFYRYNSICEPDLIYAFRAVGLHVVEESYEIYTKRVAPSTRVSLIEKHLKEENPLFVFSVNFFPDIAEICHIYGTPYVGWTVDSPVPELFSKAITYETTHLYLFDYEQYLRFSPYNPEGIHYLPLGTNIDRFDKTLSTITTQEKKQFKHDISFVGSLYTEKNPLHQVDCLSDYTQGFIEALVNSSMKLYGANMIESALSSQVVEDILFHANNLYQIPDPIEPMDKYVIAHQYVGTQVTETERIQTLNALAKHFNVHLYTRSATSSLKNVVVHEGANSLTEMPKILHLSKINLNMTSKPIMSGLPLRIFDIMGCGGFVMTNYQYEISEYFESGVDLEIYSSMDELLDKCSYYLTHDEERVKIARNGYRKVRENHTWYHRIAKILKTIVLE